MIYNATKLITAEMDRTGIKYSVDENEKSSVVAAGFTIDNGPSTRVQFISRDNDNDVAIRLFGLVGNISEGKRDKVLAVVNKCNADYRFIRFVLDDDGDVNVEYDTPVKTPDNGVGPQCCEIFIRIMKIMDDVYPEFMKAIWS